METELPSAPDTPAKPTLGRASAVAVALLPRLVILGIAYLLWDLFAPGLMSFDSIEQYRQATQGSYNDVHPPIMSLTLAAAFAMGLGLGHVMYAQCALGLLGIYQLTLAAIPTICGDRPGPLGRAVAGLLTILLLLVPISPLAHHLMTFWKDVWLMIAFCWLCAIWLTVVRNPPSGFGYWFRLLAFLGLATLSVLVRHNALTVLPVTSAMFAWMIGMRIGWKVGVLALVVPGVTFTTANKLITDQFQVQHVPVDLVVRAADFAALYYEYPDMIAEFPFAAGFLTPQFRQTFTIEQYERFGPSFTPAVMSNHEQLAKEYQDAAKRYPMRLLRVKYLKFQPHFARNQSLRFHADIDPNPYGLVFRSNHDDLRMKLRTALWATFETPFLRWPFAHHGVWLIPCAILTVVFGLRWLVLRGGSVAWVVLLVPIAYSGSFFLASVASDFRYLYPSTLVLQVIGVSMLFGMFVRGAAATFGRSEDWRW